MALTTSRLAADGGVNVQTIRFYERQGLLPKPPRLVSGYRAFPNDSVARVRFIKRAQELGFTLREVKELLVLRAHPDTACESVRRQAESKIADIDQKLITLRSMRKELVAFTRACAGTHQPHECPLLTRLDRADTRARTHRRRG